MTGLVVNRKLNVKRTYARNTKAMAHQLYAMGSFAIDGTPGSMNQLEGRFSFIDQLDKYNNNLDEAKHDAYHLNNRELQYRAFMFYRNFYAHEVPLIITEGKTDVRYLKAALMKHYTKYPNLIEKGDSGEYIFKIDFFRRSNRWKDFFGISLDGGDAMKILYRYFTGKKGAKDYFAYFQRISGREQLSPVILVYDNETESKRPLKSFLSEDAGITQAEIEELKTNLHIKLLKNSKLFLLTNPLVAGKKECEIEDLFTASLLETEIESKTFSRKDKFDPTKHYGKDAFSKHVLKNYQSIDFEGFFPLLDALNNIVENCKTTVAASS